MMTFGKSLREAREAKGLTIAQVAETTHMTPGTVAELENEDFSRIAAPIYGRGFVKLYCSAVGLDPKPFLDEFMEILNGNRDTIIRERSVSVESEDAESPADATPTSEPDAESPLPAEEPSEPEEPSALEPPPAAFESRPPVISQQDFFREEPVAPEPPPARTIIPPPQAAAAESAAPTVLPTPATHEPTLSRYAPPAHRALSGSIPSPAYWRIGALAAAALLVLALICLGIRALYRATAAEPEPAKTAEAAKPAATTTAAKKQESKTPPKTKTTVARTPQKIPSLYID